MMFQSKSDPKFLDVLQERHSKRQFLNQDVDDTTIEKIISYTNQCPTAGNLQSYYIYAIKNQQIKNSIGSAALGYLILHQIKLGQNWIATAPCVLVFIALKKKSGETYGIRGSELFAIQDATIACSHAQLIIQALGMGCCWVGAFDEQEVGKILGLTNLTQTRPIAILPFGYSSQPYKLRERRKLKDVFMIMK